MDIVIFMVFVLVSLEPASVLLILFGGYAISPLGFRLKNFWFKEDYNQINQHPDKD